MESFKTTEQLPLTEMAVEKEQERIGGLVGKKSTFTLAMLMSLMTSIGCASNGEKFDINKTFEKGRDELIGMMHRASVETRADLNSRYTPGEFHNETNIRAEGGVGYPLRSNEAHIRQDDYLDSTGEAFDLHTKKHK